MIDIDHAILTCKVVRGAIKLGLIKRPPPYAIRHSDYARCSSQVYHDLLMQKK